MTAPHVVQKPAEVQCVSRSSCPSGFQHPEMRASVRHCWVSERIQRRTKQVSISPAVSQQNKHHVDTLSAVLQAECPRPELFLQSRSSGKRSARTRRRGQRSVVRVGCGYGCQLTVGSGRISLPTHVIQNPSVSKKKIAQRFTISEVSGISRNILIMEISQETCFLFRYFQLILKFRAKQLTDEHARACPSSMACPSKNPLNNPCPTPHLGSHTRGGVPQCSGAQSHSSHLRFGSISLFFQF